MKNFKNMVMSGAVALLTATSFIACTDGNDWEVDSSYDRLFHSTQSSLSVTPTATTAEVSFGKTPNTTYYIMQVSKDSLFDGVDESAIVIKTFGEDGSITTTPYTLTGLAGDTKYYFRMKGRYVPQNVPAGAEACPNNQPKESHWVYLKKFSFKTKAEQIFNAITDEDRDETTIHLSWTPNAEVTNIEVLNGDEVVQNIQLSDEAKQAGELTVADLTPSTFYTFVIYNADAKRGTVSATTADASPAAEYKFTCTGDLDADLKAVAAKAAADGKTSYSVTAIIKGGTTVDLKSLSDEGTDANLVIPSGMSVTFFGGAGAVPTLNFVKCMDIAGAHSSITFQNLNVVGTGYFINQSNAGSVSELNIIDCKVRGFKSNTFLRIQSASVSISKINVKNSVFTECGNNYAFFDLRNGSTSEVSIENSTFYNLCTNGKGLILSSGKNFSSVEIRNVTFYNVFGNNQYFIDFGSGYGATNFVIENCLFAKSADEVTKNIRSTVNPTVVNSWTTTTWAKTIKGAEALGLDDAAVFKNADEGDLTIINSSVASKNVGDPRWIVAE